MKKGVFFTIDAVFALLAILSIVSLFTLLSLESVSPELVHESLHFQTGDMIGVMAKLKLKDIWDNDLIVELYDAGFIDDADYNMSALELQGYLWSMNATNSSEAMRNFTSRLFMHLVPDNVHWSFRIGNETLYNTTDFTADSRMVAVSRRMVSGYMKGESHVGFTAKAFLSNILGKHSADYFFFGGFVGQGNVTGALRNIPYDANISQIYMEMNIGANFTLYINGAQCGQFNKTSGNFSVDSWTVNDSGCIGNLTPGAVNNFTLSFHGDDITTKYVGGGFIKALYNTSEFGEIMTGTDRYYFPGIEGILNLYDSFYVPGNVTNMSGYLKLYNEQVTELVIGNKTIYSENGTFTTQEIFLLDQNFSSLDYSDISGVTVPLRLKAWANTTGDKIGIGDVVLITDVSGSMDWRVGYNDTTSGQTWGNDCTNPNMYSDPDTQRLALARCLDKQFIDIVMNGTGNMIALVSFSTNVANWTSLTSDEAYLNSTVDTYSANGGTCICCAINKAREILEAQSYPGRLRYIVVMSDGITGFRCLTQGCCYWWCGDTSPTDRNIYDVSFINETDGFAVGERRVGFFNWRGRIIRWDGSSWTTFANPNNRPFYGVNMFNETLGFATTSDGVILKWDGSSWSSAQQPVNTPLRSVFVVNGTLAYAVGDSGRVVAWDGSSWALSQTLAGTLYSVTFNQSRTEGFIVGSGGNIYRWTNASPTWASVTSPTSEDLQDVAYTYDTTYPAYAVGGNGEIIRWNGTDWQLDTSPTSIDLYTLLFINETVGYTLGQGGEIAKWTPYSWEENNNPSSDRTIFSSDRVNSTLAYGVGASGFFSNGRILRWEMPLWNGTDTTGSQCCGGGSGDCDNENCDTAINNAIWSAEYAKAGVTNLTIHSIGFGPIADCHNANYTLSEIALAGGGGFNVSSNITELREIYQQLGLNILINSTVLQQVQVIGSMSMHLYPESYIQFTYNMSVPPLGYKEISIMNEVGPFDNCTGNFSIPAWFTPYEARATSYSSNYWTHNVSVKSTNTGGEWFNVFNLSVYGLPYQMLGDPFSVSFPASLLRPNETNFIDVRTGQDPVNQSSDCSTANRLIYTAKFPAYAPFSSVLPEAVGRNVTVYYDLDGDGSDDGNTTVLIGYEVPGVDFDPTPRTVDELTPEFNAIDDAFIRLLDYINFDDQRCVPGDTSRSGMPCNPVDIELASDIIFRISSVAEIPYLWGPVDGGVITWVKGD